MDEIIHEEKNNRTKLNFKEGFSYIPGNLYFQNEGKHMAPVKFVHVMKRIETLQRDISEIHALQQDIHVDREYSVPLRISLEQQVNNLLNEKTKLMEVRIENAPEYFTKEKKIHQKTAISDSKAAMSFDHLEREYFENLRYKRSNYINENSVNIEKMTDQRVEGEKKGKLETKGIPSLAEKSLIKSGSNLNDDEKAFIKRREDLLKNLPPLEY